MVLKFPDSADSADLAAAGYSQVIILGGGTDSASTSATADYLILAGGGGGGSIIAGGGGAGGYRTSWGTGADGSGGNSGGLSSLETALTLNNGTAYSITVGQGGEGGFGWNAAAADANPHQGRDTTISGSDITTITSDGGGGGSAYNHNTGAIKDGGSAGGGALGDNSSGTPTTGQGFSGGISGDTNAAGGGGGGAGQAGGNSNAGGSNTLAGTGGDGLASTITGTSVVRGGGGSGGARGAAGQYLGDYSTTPIPGGDGGGGVGGILNGRVPWVASGTNNASDGRAGYGGGGGGGGYTGTNGSVINAGNGGSGIAIFRIPSTVTYSASQLVSDVSSLTNCTASYLNTQVYTDDTNYSSVNLLLDGSSLSKDLSPAPLTITNSSVALSTTDPGSHPYATSFLDYGTSGNKRLNVSSPDFAFDGQFTVEGWAYINSHKNYHVLVSTRPNNGGYATAWHLGTNANGALIVYSNNFLQQSANSAVPAGQWFHFAWTRDASNVCRLFVDGTVVDTDTISTNFTYTDVGIGNFPGSFIAGEQFYGEMADIRITPGVARYTSNFSTPTAAFPNRETSTGGDHVITFTVATEDPYDGATTNDGTATWTPTLSTTIPAPSTTWTIPEGVDSFSIMAIGAGGAAGYSDSASAGGGGGGGGLAYLNNISVTQGNDTVQSITVGGGQLGFGGESDGGDGTDLTVTMNLATADPAMNLSGYTLNPYGQDSYDSSFEGIDRTVPLGAANLLSAGLEGAQNSFEIEADINYSYIKSLAETDPNTTNRWGYNPTTQAYNQDSYPFRSVDNTGRNSLDSSQYYDSDVVATFFLQNTWEEMYKAGVLGTFDSIDGGNGGFTLFRVFSTVNAAQFGALAGNSPYVDSNGQITISTTGDPYDFNGYGPQDLNQILIVKNLTP